MTSAEIEIWALRIIEKVVSGAANEDSRVELKRDWIDVAKAARRIAGHANASHGEPILWLFGVDETLGPIGVKKNELSKWWPQVCSSFDGAQPTMLRDLIVQSRGADIVALLFETSRFPYLIRHEDRLEIPWREATKTRSARREEVLQMLTPQVTIPNFEILSATLQLANTGPVKDLKTEWRVNMEIYVAPKTSDRFCLPFHKCHVEVRSKDETLLFAPAMLTAPQHDKELVRFGVYGSATLRQSASEIIVDGPGSFTVTSGVQTDLSKFDGRAAVAFGFQGLNSTHTTVLTADLGAPTRMEENFREWSASYTRF